MRIWCRGFAVLGTARKVGDKTKEIGAMSMAAILWVAACCSEQGLAVVVVDFSEDVAADCSFDRLRQFGLQDAVVESEGCYGFTETPNHQALEIRASDDPEFKYMAQSPYYKVFFRGKTVRMTVKDAWIEFELGEELGTDIIPEQKNTENAELLSIVEQNSLSVVEVFESVDLSYQVGTSSLMETLILREAKQVEAVIQKISWEGMTPKYEEDGSILFSDEDEKEILRVSTPIMRDATGAVCEDLYYGLLETKTGYELHKIIDEKGLKWLEEAVYPVAIDPSFQVIEDWWESSGLKSSFQFFKNLNEYVNPGNGHQLTRAETDLIIPGRGLDLVISRLYETPAVFFGATPYDYEAPPVNVGKGWQLAFHMLAVNIYTCGVGPYTRFNGLAINLRITKVRILC